MKHPRVFLLVLSLLTVCELISSYSHKDCGKTIYDDIKTRIIGGEVAKRGQFPWIARLGKEKNGKIIYTCGGFLITDLFVLSAAHCGQEFVHARLGEHDGQCNGSSADCVPPQDIKIKRFFEGGYDRATFKNDIILVELKHAPTFNDFVRTVCLPTHHIPYEDLLHKKFTVAGWGFTNSTTKFLPSSLMFSINPIVERRYCEIFEKDIDGKQICTGVSSISDFSEGACDGDSGGPATMQMLKNGERRAHLIGIVSFGNHMCEMGPKVYTDVSSWLEWISSKIKTNHAVKNKRLLYELCN